MKNILLGLSMCMMLLCTSAVSYGSDGATITKSDEVVSMTMIDSISTMDVTVVPSEAVAFSYSTDYTSASSMDIYNADHVMVATASNELTLEAFDWPDLLTKNTFLYLNNYDVTLDKDIEPDLFVSNGYYSNHVGKLCKVTNSLDTDDHNHLHLE